MRRQQANNAAPLLRMSEELKENGVVQLKLIWLLSPPRQFRTWTRLKVNNAIHCISVFFTFIDSTVIYSVDVALSPFVNQGLTAVFLEKWTKFNHCLPELKTDWIFLVSQQYKRNKKWSRLIYIAIWSSTNFLSAIGSSFPAGMHEELRRIRFTFVKLLKIELVLNKRLPNGVVLHRNSSLCVRTFRWCLKMCFILNEIRY